MNQKIALNQGIKYVIIGVALLLFLMMKPLGLWEKTEVFKSNEVQAEESGPINIENTGDQVFLARGKYLDTVEVYALNEMQSETIAFRIFDSAGEQLCDISYKIGKDVKLPGFLQIPAKAELEEDMAYFYRIEGISKDLFVAYEDTAASGFDANGALFYGGTEISGRNVITRYIYKEPLPVWLIIGMVVLLFALALGLCIITDILLLKKYQNKNREITLQNLMQWIANPVLVLGVIYALWSVFPKKTFGVGIVNYSFYYVGILLTAVVLLFGINYKRKAAKTVIVTGNVLLEKISLWLMTVCFAKILWSCYEYINGLYDVHHVWACCKILTWLGLTYLCTLKKEEWMKIWNLVYLVPAAVVAYLRYKPLIGIESEEAITGRLQAKLIFVTGFVALQIFVSFLQLILKKRKANGSWAYGYLGIFTIVIAFMIIFRNTREWPVIAAIMFGVFYYRMWLWEKRSYLMQIFCNGIILNFIYMVYYCLMHRPYHRFRHNRFGMGFHTVTMTGYYLALVLCAVIIRLFAKYYETKRWQECWKELSLLGIGNAYLIMTLSRTGYLAALVMEIFMCAFFVILKEKKKLWGIMKKLAVGTAVSVMFFPVVFTAQRILPAVVNDPIYSEVEIWNYIVEKDEPKDSELYIDITAFVKIAVNKLLGIDTGNISLSSITQPVYVKKDTVMVASEMEESYDISSGRLEIFREYIEEWNLTGHDAMGFPFPDGSISAHAHNSFLQVIHDHGLITGVLFLIFGILSFILSVKNYSMRKQEGEEFYNALSVAVILAFAFAGMVEWIFHFANPMGFAIFIVIIPLLFQQYNGEKNEK